MNSHYLSALFTPRNVAMFGASDRTNSVGEVVFRNLLEAGFKGKIYPINPKSSEVQGQPAFPSLDEVKDVIDLAVIATPAQTVPAIAEQCGKHGVRMMLILSAGFRETGAAGIKLENEVIEIAKRYGIRVMGPNCLGIIRPNHKLNATFANHGAQKGDIALVSQSGAICTAILDWAEVNDIGFSAVVSTGIAADLDFGDFLDYLVMDPATKSIMLYIEGVKDARHFMSSLRAAARIKPVIVLKVGRHAAGAKASMSHTGALVGSDDVFSAALARSGALRVDSVSQMYSAARALASHRYRGCGERLIIITNGGGPGVMAADRASDLKIPLSQLSDASIEKLNEVLPGVWSHNNPVDVIGDATPERYRAVVEICLADENVDGALVILTPQAMTDPNAVAEALIDLEKHTNKPLFTSWMGGAQVNEAREMFKKAHLPTFTTLENAVDAFSSMVAYNRNQRLLLQTPTKLKDGYSQPDREGAQLIIESVLADRRHVLTEQESYAVFNAFKIPTVRSAIAYSASDALIQAENIGFPVAMKVLSKSISHKSSVGGVRLNLESAREVTVAYRHLMQHMQDQFPGEEFSGVTISKMERRPNGRELMIGIVRDPVFGPVISFGIGGTSVEAVGDSALALPPLNRRLAIDLIERTRAAKMLGQYGSKPPVDREKLIDVLRRVSNLACELPWIEEMDINPLIIDETGAIAVDGRINVRSVHQVADPYEHLAIHPYPAHLISSYHMSDGSEIMIRPIRPEDADIEQQFVRSLSEEAKYFRFMNAPHELSREMLVRFTQIDYFSEMALIAVNLDREEETEIGVARYITNPDGRSCEFALVVSDKWQRKGIAHKLMNKLIDVARDRGLAVIEGQVLSNNVNMLNLMNSMGFSLRRDPDDTSITWVELPLN